MKNFISLNGDFVKFKYILKNPEKHFWILEEEYNSLLKEIKKRYPFWTPEKFRYSDLKFIFYSRDDLIFEFETYNFYLYIKTVPVFSLLEKTKFRKYK